MEDIIHYSGKDKFKKEVARILNEGGGTEVDPTVPSWAKDPDGLIPLTLVEINDMFRDW